jgi:ubiquitin-protein ligase
MPFHALHPLHPLDPLDQLTARVQIHGHLPPGIALVKAEDFQEWLMDIEVLDANPLYMNETYRLKFRFSNNYPIGPSFPFPPSSSPLNPQNPRN